MAIPNAVLLSTWLSLEPDQTRHLLLIETVCDHLEMGISIGDAADALGISASFTSRIAKRLEDSRLIKRRTLRDDERVTTLSPTQRGLEIHERMQRYVALEASVLKSKQESKNAVV